jgi:hypothetical protein
MTPFYCHLALDAGARFFAIPYLTQNPDTKDSLDPHLRIDDKSNMAKVKGWSLSLLKGILEYLLGCRVI